MQAAGHELLSGAVGAEDEDPGVRSRDLVYHLAYVPHGLGTAHHLLAVDLLLEDPGLRHEVGLVAGVLDRDEYAVEVQRLLDEVEGALLDALHGGVYVSVAGDHHHGGLYPGFHEFAEHLYSVHPGHLYVAEDDVVFFLVSSLEAFFAVLGGLHRIAFVGEDLLQRIADGPFVIDYQYLHNTANIGNYFYICLTMNVPDIIIAIDGYSSTGKSSFAKLVAKKFDFLYLDSGALYRGVTLFAREEGLISEGNVIDPLLEERLAGLDLHFNEEGKLCTGERCIEKEIRSMEVSSQVSPIAAVPYVRAFVDEKLREYGRKGRIVMDGRDIGTAVFPNAELKIFMTASEEVRAQRRFDELVSKGENPTLEDVVKNLRDRDYIDSHRETNPLRRADDAYGLDNTEMGFTEELAWIQGLIQGKFGIL